MRSYSPLLVAGVAVNHLLTIKEIAATADRDGGAPFHITRLSGFSAISLDGSNHPTASQKENGGAEAPPRC
jgi:hypothetical protein